jgi:hypothetical protein
MVPGEDERAALRDVLAGAHGLQAGTLRPDEPYRVSAGQTCATAHGDEFSAVSESSTMRDVLASGSAHLHGAPARAHAWIQGVPPLPDDVRDIMRRALDAAAEAQANSFINRLIRRDPATLRAIGLEPGDIEFTYQSGSNYVTLRLVPGCPRIPKGCTPRQARYYTVRDPLL